MTTEYKNIPADAKRYVDAAARCLYMQHLYGSAGTAKMDARAAKSLAKQCEYEHIASDMTGETWGVIHSIVIEKCREIEGRAA